jgi:ABC-type transport system involved in cytochrome bd biosynthesis fused ATPase/permease subunit
MLRVGTQHARDKVSFYLATRVEDSWRFCALDRFYRLPMHWHNSHDSGEVGAKSVAIFPQQSQRK